ncbi:MAG: nucleotidyltransferase family protein [Acidobacteria bacterium]|nr:nucleotidyltransferase family protein [Acidobacteriota bacterium]MBI3425564.1 nucleotidyltransferase family protein [Acidobacteriota bacterium]
MPNSPWPAWVRAETFALETQLLLTAARVGTAQPASVWNDALPSLAWDKVLAEARRQGVTAQLCQWLETPGMTPAPAAVVEELRQLRQQNMLRNLRMTGELFALCGLLAEHGIEAIPFKGPTLAALAGAELSWRSFGDLDLLVDRRAVAQASTMLRARGYELHLDWQASQDPRFLDVTYTLEFFSRASGIMVELHWALFPRYLGFGFNFAEMRERLITVKPGGKALPTLGPEDLLLYLCAHGAKHCWPHLNGVLDIARLLASRDDWQWESLLSSARQRQVERVTRLGLLLAHGLLDAPLPAGIIQQLTQDQALLRLGAATVTQMLSQQPAATGMQSQFRYFFQLQQSWPARLRYLLRLVTAPNIGDWEFQPLPGNWAFLYAFLRPLRLLKKYLSPP